MAKPKPIDETTSEEDMTFPGQPHEAKVTPI